MRNCLLLPILLLGACADGEHSRSWHQPDNTILVAPDATGRLTATGPRCAPFDDALVHKFANDPLPQLGCATANNLATMIANPADLVRGELPPQPAGGANAEVEAAATTRYELGRVYAPVSPTTGAGSSGGSGATAAQ